MKKRSTQLVRQILVSRALVADARCAIAFALLAVSDGLLILDNVSLPEADLTRPRLLTTSFGVGPMIGSSKSAICHHFRDKTDLIERCYARGFEIYDMIMETGVTTSSTALERSAIVFHLNTQAQMSATPPLALQPSLGKLSPGSAWSAYTTGARA